MPCLRRFLYPFILALSFVFCTDAAAAKQVSFQIIVNKIVTQGSDTIDHYLPKNGLATADLISDLYFDVFEASGMEIAIGLTDPQHKSELESLFSKVIGLAANGQPKPQVDRAWQELTQALQATAKAQSDQHRGGFWPLFIQAFIILLREGFEAMLVITALTTYLCRQGAPHKVGVIYQGVGWALAASILTAILLNQVISLAGERQEALEGITMLVAALVLFYVSTWLLAKVEPSRWKAWIDGQVTTALSKGSLFTLGFAAFLAVYREGAETVLFYQALIASSDEPFWVAALGFGAASLALVGLFWIMRRLSYQVPLTIFFSVTAALLYYLAISFAGTGVLELQEAKWVSITPLSGVPRITWLGLYPTMESLAAQCLLLLPIPFVIWRWKQSQNTLHKAKTLA